MTKSASRFQKTQWKALDDSFTYSSPIILEASGRRQLIVWTQEAVTSLDPTTGRTWWREQMRTPGDHAVSTPVFCNHRLLIAGLCWNPPHHMGVESAPGPRRPMPTVTSSPATTGN